MQVNAHTTRSMEFKRYQAPKNAEEAKTYVGAQQVLKHADKLERSLLDINGKDADIEKDDAARVTVAGQEIAPGGKATGSAVVQNGEVTGATLNFENENQSMTTLSIEKGEKYRKVTTETPDGRKMQLHENSANGSLTVLFTEPAPKSVKLSS